MDRTEGQEREAPRRCFRSRGPEETRAIARALTEAIDRCVARGGLVISLSGELGAGKTVFVKGLAEGLGIESGQVSSPTFVIANQYGSPSGRRLNHVDFYRLESEAELETMGFDDLLDRSAVVAVEWGDRFERALPRDRLELRLSRTTGSPEAGERTHEGASDGSLSDTGSEERVLEARASGPDSARVLQEWCFPE